jgi:hypothetical protein
MNLKPLLSPGPIGGPLCPATQKRPSAASPLPMPLEREADNFASHLLIPTDKVTESVAKIGLDLKALAKEFLVSEQAMTIRLLEMNLIK